MIIDSEEVIISRIWDNHGKEVGYEQKGVLVRCKDCKQYMEWLDGRICARLGSYHGDTKPTDYCSYGERQDHEE